MSSAVPPDPAAQRRSYSSGGLFEHDLAASWTEQFRTWLRDAHRLREPNAMVLATADRQGRPSARTVLLKGFDERGFVLFTNLTSRKGQDAADNPFASLVFPWHDIERQVVVAGALERVGDDESREYFRSRPRGSQLGAWVSRQSTVIADRNVLDRRWAELAARWPGEVPWPHFWGGLRVAPQAVEFWQGRSNRLHDRLRYRRDDDRWVVERLSP